MTQVDLDKGMIVVAAWRLAASSDPIELLAVACTLRNGVIRPFVSPARPHFRSYGDCVDYYLRQFATRPHPTGNEPQLIDPSEGLLSKIDGLYANTTPDVTASLSAPNGASSFDNPLTPAVGPRGRLIGRFGAMNFYE